ncbi:hypothetical protein HPB47_020362 [Ixodes persulcatus]|uniref:Uncharacterized protein n=1 Tax=Ixodes persulcatus TaxID=34615 RepID=A0AC60QFK2_IXOPE|nr:hypothetical protein HPB47_020362 [Ixodes persulcatus]
MFFIHSAAGHQVHRNVLRHFVGNAALSSAYDWTTVFFVGISKNRTLGRAVQEEAAKYGDVVVLPYEDTYQNLTYKFVYGMKWTIEFCPSVKYIVKIDDDMVANLVRVVRYLRRMQASPGFELHCFVWSRATVFRATSSPWYMPTDVYPRDKFPDYCSGRGVLFKSGALRRLYSASFCVPFHGIDDVYVTGDAALWAKNSGRTTDRDEMIVVRRLILGATSHRPDIPAKRRASPEGYPLPKTPKPGEAVVSEQLFVVRSLLSPGSTQLHPNEKSLRRSTLCSKSSVDLERPTCGARMTDVRCAFTAGRLTTFTEGAPAASSACEDSRQTTADLV